jgi:hypothetical protein
MGHINHAVFKFYVQPVHSADDKPLDDQPAVVHVVHPIYPTEPLHNQPYQPAAEHDQPIFWEPLHDQPNQT